MTLPDGAVRALRRVFGTLIPIACACVGGYLVYWQHRTAYLMERDERAVAALRDEIRGSLDAVATVIATEQRTCVSRRRSCSSAGDAARQYPDLHPVKDEKVWLPPAGPTGTRVGVIATQDRATVYVSYEAKCDRDGDVFKVAASDCMSPANACVPNEELGADFQSCSSIPLEALVGSLLRNGSLFDAIVLTVGPIPVAIRSTLPLDIREDLRRALESRPQAPPADSKQSIDADVAKAEQALASRSMPSLALGRLTFHRFTDNIAPGALAGGQPSDPGTAKAAAGSTDALRVHALVRSDALQSEAREIPNEWLVALVAGLVLAVISWPLLKIWSMGSHERLNGLDVRLLVLSLFVGTGIFTLGLLQLYGHRVLVAAFDRQLGEIAARLEMRLTEELTDAHAALTGSLRDGRPLAYGDFSQIMTVGEEDRTGKTMWVPRPSQSGWELKELPAPLLKVKDRGYYTDLKAGRLWSIPSVGKAGFAAEVVASRTDGRPTLVVAVADPQPSPRLIGMRVGPLVDAVLPYGFGFAFVDERGSVQLHSDRLRDVVENFVDECDGDTRIMPAILEAPEGETTLPLDATYRGAPHRLVVHRIPGTAWRLIVFRDQRLLDRINNEVIAAWSSLYVAYATGFLVLLLVVQIAHDGYRADWLWPDRGNPGLYMPATIRLLATAPVAYVVLGAQPGASRLAMLAAIAAATTAGLCLALGQPREEVLASQERSLARVVAVGAAVVVAALVIRAGDWPMALVVGALAVAWLPSPTLAPSQGLVLLAVLVSVVLDRLGVAPLWWASLVVVSAAGCLPRKIAPWRAMTDRLVAAVGRWSTRVETWLGGPEEPQEWTFRFSYTAMLFALLVVVAVVPAATLYADARRQVIGELARFGARDFARRAVQRTMDFPERASAGLYPTSWITAQHAVPGPLHTLAGVLFPRMPNFGPPIPTLRALANDDSPAPAAPALGFTPVTSAAWISPPPPRSLTVPRWLPLRFERTLFVVLWGALVVIGFGVLWSVVRLLFLLDVDRTEAGGNVNPRRGSFIVWTLSPAARISLTEQPSEKQDLIDLREPLSAAALAAKADNANAPVLEIDHLECVLADSTLHAAILDLLEQLVLGEKRLVHGKQRAVVLTSEVDPLHYVSARVEEAANDRHAAVDAPAAQAATVAEAAATALVDRWARLLDGFQRIRWEVPPGDRIAPDKKSVADLLASKYPGLPDRDGAPADEADEACEARHWQLWRQCTRAEKLALRHLAEEGFLNPNGKDVVRPLMRRLLVRRSPAFCLPTEAFRRFVLRAETCATVGEWEQKGVRSAWARLREPLMVLALLAATYLLVAEPDAFNWSIALATGVAAGLPAILKLLAMIGDQRTGAGAR
jgi:hypothetical protein